jgi:hypothetical protein
MRTSIARECSHKIGSVPASRLLQLAGGFWMYDPLSVPIGDGRNPSPSGEG